VLFRRLVQRAVGPLVEALRLAAQLPGYPPFGHQGRDGHQDLAPVFAADVGVETRAMHLEKKMGVRCGRRLNINPGWRNQNKDRRKRQGRTREPVRRCVIAAISHSA
jgi:hypothetical protein